MSFARNLEAIMREKHVSQKALANGICKSKVSVSKYVAGVVVPREEVQHMIADYLGCTVEQLNDEEDDVPIDIENPKSWDILVPKGMKNVPVSICAKLIGTGNRFVQMALQQGTAPFGFAAKSERKWFYHISRAQLMRYMADIKEDPDKEIKIENQMLTQ